MDQKIVITRGDNNFNRSKTMYKIYDQKVVTKFFVTRTIVTKTPVNKNAVTKKI